MTDDKKREGLGMIIDCSVLQKMLENDEHANEVLTRLIEAKENNIPVTALTTIASLQRAIWMAKTIHSDQLKKLNDILTVAALPGCDFKDEEAVRTQLIQFANYVSEAQELQAKIERERQGDGDERTKD